MYLIEILHQTTTANGIAMRCTMLYLIEILHQTTTSQQAIFITISCILSKFYIKPQQAGQICLHLRVVSYRNSTSNHNKLDTPLSITEVVSYRNSTSNHNFGVVRHYSCLVVSYRNSTSNHNYLIAFAHIRPVVSYRNSTSNHNEQQNSN